MEKKARDPTQKKDPAELLECFIHAKSLRMFLGKPIGYYGFHHQNTISLFCEKKKRMDINDKRNYIFTPFYEISLKKVFFERGPKMLIQVLQVN